MMKHRTKGFTIIELLVVVSIIALLIGILLPAIGKARDRAHLTRSQSNIRNLMVAHNTYGAEWNDNQWSPAPHNLARHGNSYSAAYNSYAASLNPGGGANLATILIGWAGGAQGGYWYFGEGFITTYNLYMPIGLTESTQQYFGYFRLHQVESFNNYLNGNFYDQVFYAPKDRNVIAAIGECFDAPGFCSGTAEPIYWSSYCLSPAALFNPAVMTYDFWQNDGNLWQNPGALRVPTFSQARYPDLKSHLMEHHWLQNTRLECNPLIAGGNYDGCTPYQFNHSIWSVPVTAFYDGSIRGLGTRESQTGDARVRVQSGGGLSAGLWLRNTPLGATGYQQDIGFPPGYVQDSGAYANTSYHILTNGGILGRDASPEG